MATAERKPILFTWNRNSLKVFSIGLGIALRKTEKGGAQEFEAEHVKVSNLYLTSNFRDCSVTSGLHKTCKISELQGTGGTKMPACHNELESPLHKFNSELSSFRSCQGDIGPPNLKWHPLPILSLRYRQFTGP